MTNHRSFRVAQQMQVELSKLIAAEVRDPRLTPSTITGVEVTRDYSYAKVYVVVRDKNQEAQTLEILNKAAGFLRRALSKEMQLRTVPQLQFLADTSLAYGNHIDDLLRKVPPAHDDETPEA